MFSLTSATSAAKKASTKALWSGFIPTPSKGSDSSSSSLPTTLFASHSCKSDLTPRLCSSTAGWIYSAPSPTRRGLLPRSQIKSTAGPPPTTYSSLYQRYHQRRSIFGHRWVVRLVQPAKDLFMSNSASTIKPNRTNFKSSSDRINLSHAICSNQKLQCGKC